MFLLSDSIQITGKDILSIVTETDILSDTTIAVAEAALLKGLKLYNVDGRFIKNIGKSGDGPGEYRNPFKIETSNGKLLVYDNINNVIIEYNDKGNYVTSLKLNISYFDMQCNADYIVMLNLQRKRVETGCDIAVYDIKGNLIYEDDLHEDKNELLWGKLFGGGFKIAIKDKILYYIGADTYKLMSYNLEERKSESKCKETPGNIVLPDIEKFRNRDYVHKARGKDVPYSVIQGLRAADNGLVFVETSYHIIIYDKYCNYLSTVDKPDYLLNHSMEIYKDEIMFFPISSNIYQNTVRNTYIYRYKII